LAKTTADKLLSSLEGKSFTVKEALERSTLWNQAYTGAGKVGKSAKAGVYNVMTRAIKNQIANLAPEVAKKTSELATTYALPKIIRNILITTGAAAGGLAGAKYLLGQNQGQK
jgi:hypothetical protein